MIVLGRIVAPFGVNGWVRLHPFGDDPAAWTKLPQWRLAKAPEGDESQDYQLTALKPRGGGWIVKFDGVDDCNAAEALAGRYVLASREELPRTAANEYYWADLVGLAVVNEQGAALGEVESLIESAANDVLVVRDGQQKRLLPFVAQVVKDVDVAKGRICVDWGSDW